MAVEDRVELSRASLAKYMSESNKRMLSASKGGVVDMKGDGLEAEKIKRWKVRERMEGVRSKNLHGQFLMEIDEIATENSWLRTGYLKKEPEGLLVAAQSQALRTNAIKAKINKSQENSLCCQCHQNNETVNHIVSECPKIARHNINRDTTLLQRPNIGIYFVSMGLTLE